MVDIILIKDDIDIAHAKRIFVEFATCLDFAALFKDVQCELEDTPSAYIPPEGCLHIAVVDMQVVGCSVVKRIDRHACELKRLYVLPGFRRRGIGRTLVQTTINKAENLGYKIMHLTTMPYMKDAIAIYHELGFKLVEPEQHDHSSKALYMELTLPNDG